MKKIFKGLVLLLSVTVFASCSNGTDKKTSDTSSSVSTEISTTSSEKTGDAVTIGIKVDGKEVSSKKVTVKDGETLMEVLKANFEIVEDSGMVATIDGVTQNEGDNVNKWWMYQVNGTDATVGAADYALKAGDQVEFELRDFS